jgi:hypothetical protein
MARVALSDAEPQGEACCELAPQSIRIAVCALTPLELDSYKKCEEGLSHGEHNWGCIPRCGRFD